MNQIIDFAAVSGAVVFSIALGVYLEWLGLRGLMRLMPVTRVAQPIFHRNGEKSHRSTKAA